MKIQMINKKFILTFLLIALLVIPVISWAGDSRETIYVDDDAEGEEDGSYEKPYSSISEAIEEVDEDEKAEIIVNNGYYEENIEIPEDVKIIGEDKKEVIIKAKTDKKPAVIMENDTELQKVTIIGGRNGIRVKNGGKGEISIIKVYVQDATRDGIFIEEGKKGLKYTVSIIDSKIFNNDKSGIYSRERELVIMESEIFDNDLDGIDLEENVDAYISNNEVYENKGVGLKLRVDKSEIIVRKNDITKNDKDGIEVRAGAKKGEVTIRKNDIAKNDDYGIAKIQKVPADEDLVWSEVYIEDNNGFDKNEKGNISDIIRMF